MKSECYRVEPRKFLPACLGKVVTISRLMDPFRCSGCHLKKPGWGVVWASHRGGPLCETCAREVVSDVWELMRRSVECEGGCGRRVVDSRNRRQKTITCSDACRRQTRNEHRRMERRAMLPVPSLGCVECGSPLVLTRSDVRYCSARCRVRAHRRRRRSGPTRPYNDGLFRLYKAELDGSGPSGMEGGPGLR
jgi:hypothetical protein